MVLAYNVNIVGLKELQDKFAKMPEVLQMESRGVTEDAAQTFVRLAKNAAPVNMGVLKNGITYAQVISDKTHTTFEVVSNVKYSPYIEFGTKGKFAPYPGTEQFASQFRGKGTGTIDEFFLNILDWVKSKGIADTKTKGGRRKRADDSGAYDAAFAIMMSILKKGVKPHPYFFRHIPIVKKQLEKEINNILVKL